MLGSRFSAGEAKIPFSLPPFFYAPPSYPPSFLPPSFLMAASMASPAAFPCTHKRARAGSLGKGASQHLASLPPLAPSCYVGRSDVVGSYFFTSPHPNGCSAPLSLSISPSCLAQLNITRANALPSPPLSLSTIFSAVQFPPSLLLVSFPVSHRRRRPRRRSPTFSSSQDSAEMEKEREGCKGER